MTMQLHRARGGNVFMLLLLIAISAFILGIGMPTVSVYILTATLLAPALDQTRRHADGRAHVRHVLRHAVDDHAAGGVRGLCRRQYRAHCRAGPPAGSPAWSAGARSSCRSCSCSTPSLLMDGQLDRDRAQFLPRDLRHLGSAPLPASSALHSPGSTPPAAQSMPWCRCAVVLSRRIRFPAPICDQLLSGVDSGRHSAGD